MKPLDPGFKVLESYTIVINKQYILYCLARPRDSPRPAVSRAPLCHLTFIESEISSLNIVNTMSPRPSLAGANNSLVYARICSVCCCFKCTWQDPGTAASPIRIRLSSSAERSTHKDEGTPPHPDTRAHASDPDTGVVVHHEALPERSALHWQSPSECVKCGCAPQPGSLPLEPRLDLDAQLDGHWGTTVRRALEGLQNHLLAIPVNLRRGGGAGGTFREAFGETRWTACARVSAAAHA